MKKRYWLSYDLGVGGDYAHLYQWLDDRKAVPCGNNVAYFTYEYQPGGNPDTLLKEELEQKIALKPGNILYVIRQKGDEEKTVGTYIYGKRQAAPWTGYGSVSTEEDDE